MKVIRSYKCYKPMYMNDGRRAFTAGKFYNAYKRESDNGYEMSDDMSCQINHTMPKSWFIRFFKYKYGK
jgi:hypothetical protein